MKLNTVHVKVATDRAMTYALCNANGFCLSVGTSARKGQGQMTREAAKSQSLPSALGYIGSEEWNNPTPQCAPHEPN